MSRRVRSRKLTPAAVFAFAFAAGACAVEDARPFELDASARCSRLLPDGGTVWLDQTCGPSRCTAAIEQEGCSLAIDTSTACAGRVRASLDPAGPAVFAPAARFGACASIAPRSGAVLSATCADGPNRGCGFDLIPAVSPAPPAVDALAVFAGAQPITAAGGSSLVGLAALEGYLQGLVALDGRILVLATRGDAQPSVPGVCTPGVRSGLYLVDPDRLTVTGSVSLPPCTALLAPDPAGGGALALVVRNPRTILRLDRDGAIVTRAQIGPVDDVLAPAAFATGAGGLAALVFTGKLPLVHGSAIAAVSAGAATLAVTTWAHPAGDYRGAALDPAGRLWSGDRSAGRADAFDGTSLSPIASVLLDDVRRASQNAGPVAVTAGGRLLIAATGEYPAVWVVDLDRPSVVASALPLEANGVPWAILPRADGRAWVGLIEPGTERASVAPFDPVAGRFEPGAIAIGRGVVSALAVEPSRSSSSGRLWALLPWTGTLVRIGAR